MRNFILAANSVEDLALVKEDCACPDSFFLPYNNKTVFDVISNRESFPYNVVVLGVWDFATGTRLLASPADIIQIFPNGIIEDVQLWMGQHPRDWSQ